MPYCYVCPHRCGVDRPYSINDEEGIFGSCGCGLQPIVARAGLHMWEEPCISGTKGSGAVFFSGCNLHCVFCQNQKISSGSVGKEITVKRLREIYHELIAQGAHNINLVTPTHFAEAVIASLQEPLSVPVVYNTSGFETLDTLRRLEGKIQIYMPDLKYANDIPAIKYSNAPYYFRTATQAIKEMYRQVGSYKLNSDGIMESGVLVRHLILPGQIEDTKKIIDWIAQNFKPGQIMFSMMRQYVPCGRAQEFPEINRKGSDDEYSELEDYLLHSSIEDGFLQEKAAASENFIPCFDGSGV